MRRFLQDASRLITGVEATPSRCYPRLLIQPHDVPTRIAKPRCNLRRISTDRLYDLAAIRNHRVGRSGDTIHHDVNQQSRLARGRPLLNPFAAHLADPIVKGSAIPALPDIPTENTLIKIRRARNIGRRNLNVANLAIAERGMHGR